MAKSKEGKTTMTGGKLTPLQIAFLVDRYLLDHNYSATLSSFRLEAADLFSVTRGKDPPRGLMSLPDILHDYIALKEQKIALDLDKRNLDQLLQTIHHAVKAYHSNNPPAFNNVVAVAAAASVGNNVSQSTNSNISVVPTLPSHVPKPKKIPPGNKRKTLKSVPAAVPATKKSRTEHSDASTSAVVLPLQANAVSCVTQETFCSMPNFEIPSKDPSIQNDSAKQLPGPQVPSTSPKTPPQPLLPHSDNVDSPTESSNCSPLNNEVTPSKRSIISAKKIIVISPFKQAGYYSIERSHHVSSSPSKSSPSKLGKRTNVKSKLDFDSSEVAPCTDKLVEAQTSTSSNDVNLHTGIFDMDFPDLAGDASFSELLKDFGLFDDEADAFLSQPLSHTSVDNNLWSNPEFGVGSVQRTDQENLSGVVSKEETRIQGSDSVESMRTVTRCIKILSPAKNGRISLV